MSSPNRVPWGNLLPRLGIVAMYLGIGFFSLWRRGAEIQARLLFGMTFLASPTFACPDYLNRHGGLLTLVARAVTLLAFGGMIAVDVHLAMVIPERKTFLSRHPGFLRGLYAAGILLSLLNTARVADQVYTRGWPPLFATLSLAALFAIYGIVVPLAVAVILGHTLVQTPPGVGRTQTKVVLCGVFPWAAATVASTAVQLITGDLPPVMELLQLLATIPVPVAFGLAIFKCRLFNLDLAIRKSMVYGLLSGVLFLVYCGVSGWAAGCCRSSSSRPAPSGPSLQPRWCWVCCSIP